MKISGKRKTVITGRYPTIFPSQNTTKCSGSHQLVEKTEVASNIETLTNPNNIIHADTENSPAFNDENNLFCIEHGQTTDADDSDNE